MRVGELMRFALSGLWRQKVRTALTLVGVTVVAALFLPRKREQSHLQDDQQKASEAAVPVVAH